VDRRRRQRRPAVLLAARRAPGDLGLQSANRYTSYSYFVSPYIRGVLPGEVQYGLRYRASWSDSNQAGLAAARVEEVSGTMDSPTRRFGWGLDAYAQRTTFRDQEPLEQSLVRGRLNYSVNPDLIASLRLGYERNDYAFADYSGEIYGAGVDWRPTPRTSVNGFWEERFFGSSYTLDVSHRRRLHAVQLGFSRSTSTYTQQLLRCRRATLCSCWTPRSPPASRPGRAAGGDRALPAADRPAAHAHQSAGVLHAADPAAGARYASWAIQGVRNVIVFTYSWLDQTPITAAGAAAARADTNQNFTQQRLAVSYAPAERAHQPQCARRRRAIAQPHRGHVRFRSIPAATAAQHRTQPAHLRFAGPLPALRRHRREQLSREGGLRRHHLPVLGSIVHDRRDTCVARMQRSGIRERLLLDSAARSSGYQVANHPG
jgi:hypothetical protein